MIDETLSDDEYLAQQITILESKWGERTSMRFQANHALADWASKMLGCRADALAEIENHIGSARMFLMFLDIAKQMIEPLWSDDTNNARNNDPARTDRVQ